MIRFFNLFFCIGIFIACNGSNEHAKVPSKGENLYLSNCSSCHLSDGKGIGPYPPLANSDYLLSDPNRVIKTILYGIQDTIVVNNTQYSSGLMQSFDYLSNDEIAEICNYILNAWGNNGGNITSEMVSINREK